MESQKDQEIPARVLVVDDDDAIRTMVERILRRERFEVDSARDGFEAIEKLARSDYGTVLLDLIRMCRVSPAPRRTQRSP